MDICVSQARFVRRRSDKAICMAHTTHHRSFQQRVMFRGAMCGNRTLRLVQVNGMMNSARYITILRQTIVPFLEEQPLMQHWVFQQDNAPSHKAAITTNFLAEHAIDVLKWPPYSPDLNVIENLWGIIKGRLTTESIRNKDELNERVQAIWCSPEIQDCAFAYRRLCPGAWLCVSKIKGVMCHTERKF